jgi:hypothetical protein
MPRLAPIALGLLVVAGAAACGKVQARTPSPPPIVALDIPEPPARVTIPVELPEPEPPAPVLSPANPARPRPENANRPPDRTPPVAAAPAAPPPPNEPAASVLQTTTDTSALEQSTLGLVAEAQRNLNNVRYQDLNQQAKAQYDSARSFIKNAQEALKAKNYMYAQQLAAKAAAVARELSK